MWTPTGDPRHGATMRFSPFDDADARALVYLPLVVRQRLDEAAVRLSLSQWQRLPMVLRGAVVMMASGPEDPVTFRDALGWMVAAVAPESAPEGARVLVHRPAETPWREPAPGVELADALRALGLDPGAWSSLDSHGRFVLVHAFRGRLKNPERFVSVARGLVTAEPALPRTDPPGGGASGG